MPLRGPGTSGGLPLVHRPAVALHQPLRFTRSGIEMKSQWVRRRLLVSRHYQHTCGHQVLDRSELGLAPAFYVLEHLFSRSCLVLTVLEVGYDPFFVCCLAFPVALLFLL